MPSIARFALAVNKHKTTVAVGSIDYTYRLPQQVICFETHPHQPE